MKKKIPLSLVCLLICVVILYINPGKIFSQEIGNDFRGFILTGYYQKAYSDSLDISQNMLNGLKNIPVGILVTMYADPQTGEVSGNLKDIPSTPLIDDVISLAKIIEASGNRVCLMLYIDDSTASSVDGSRSKLIFSLKKWTESLLAYFRNQDISPFMITISPELTAMEGVQTSDWINLISALKNRFPQAKIAYAAHPESPVFIDQNKNKAYSWLSNLDYFGSTLILGAPSVSSLSYKYVSITQIVKEAARAYRVLPFIAEYGFPSHKEALKKAYVTHSEEGADQELQVLLLSRTLPIMIDSDIPFFFWGAETSALPIPQSKNFSWYGKLAGPLVTGILARKKNVFDYSAPFLDKSNNDALFVEHNGIYRLSRPFGASKRNFDTSFNTDPSDVKAKIPRSLSVNIPTCKSIRITAKLYAWSDQAKNEEKASLQIYCPNNKYIHTRQITLNADPIQEITLDIQPPGPFIDPVFHFTIYPGAYACVMYDLKIETFQ